MNQDELTTELRELLAATREQIIYLGELTGEEFVSQLSSQTATATPASIAKPPPARLAVPSAASQNALARNAAAENKADSPLKSAAVPTTSLGDFKLPAAPPRRANKTFAASTTNSKQETMPAKKKPEPAADLSSTLFGDIAPPADVLPETDETLADIRAEIGDCTRCRLCEGRTNIVHSEGNPQARLMFVGEAPGADEDAQAHPFIGRAGQLLNKIIEAIGLKREDVFIGNINRCRPPQNRAPLPDEAATCKPFLMREIAVVKPEIVVVLGNTAMKNLLDTKEGITKLRGTFQNYKGIKVMPTFHPAYLLRDPSKKREVWADMKRVLEELNKPGAS